MRRQTQGRADAYIYYSDMLRPQKVKLLTSAHFTAGLINAFAIVSKRIAVPLDPHIVKSSILSSFINRSFGEHKYRD